jgi:chemosensory pili system protein ChpC
MLAVETEQGAEVSCVILPLRGVQLVVPAACVAEVLPWRAPVSLGEAPCWCTGAMDWHGAQVPVIDYELLDATDEASRPAAGRSLVVLNRASPGAAQPFYVLIVHGVPRLVELAQVDITAEMAPESVGELSRVEVGTELLALPDLALVEARVAELAPALRARTPG